MMSFIGFMSAAVAMVCAVAMFALTNEHTYDATVVKIGCGILILVAVVVMKQAVDGGEA